MNLLATKLHQPTPPANLVARPHLLARLSTGLRAGRPLSLISAPPGYGKSVLVSAWLESIQPIAHAWLSLDPADNDPIRFYNYLLAALAQIDPDLGSELRPVVQAGQLPPPAALTLALSNDLLERSEPGVLVLDDFQTIQEQPVLAGLAQILAASLPNLHLVLISREDPPLPLARLRANNAVTEIRAEDLRLQTVEAERFLNQTLGLALSPPDVALLEQRTEGWMVGLQLAGLSLRGRPDPGSFIARLSGTHRHILGYLTEEVLARQPVEIQVFLQRTAILDRLTGSLCDALTGRSDSAALLERLTQANLFLIPLDEDAHWYRYHHLFADLLRSQHQRLPPEEIAGLHRQAARWYATHDLPSDAIRHAIQGADYPQAVELLERHAQQLLNQGYARTVEDWLQAIPPDLRSQSYRTNLAMAWMLLLRGAYAQIDPYLQAAEAALAQTTDPLAVEARTELLALQANRLHAQGHLDEAVHTARATLAQAGPAQSNLQGLAYSALAAALRDQGQYQPAAEAYTLGIQHARAAGNTVSVVLASIGLALMAFQYGHLRLSEQVCLETLAGLEQPGAAVPPITASLYGGLATVYYEWNRLGEAREQVERGLQLATLGGHNAASSLLHTIQGRILLAQGDLNGASRSAQAANDHLSRGVPAWLRPEILAFQARLQLAQGRDFAAEALLNQPDQPQPPANSLPSIVLTLARLRLQVHRLEGQPTAQLGQVILAELDEVIAATMANQRTGPTLVTLLLHARVQQALGQTAAAAADVRRAVELGAGEGYQRTFLDEGPVIQALLRGLPMTPTLQRILGDQAHSDAPPPTALATSLAEPLTERELAVLRQMAAGLKYEEMAQRLFISLNTVRFYVKQIYSKLGVNNRTRALETARGLGLLDEM